MTRSLCAAALVLCAGAQASAQAGDDEVAIRAVVARLADAWNRGDADAWVADFASDSEFVNILGTVLEGRAENQARHAKIFTTLFHATRNELVVRQLRFLAPDVAMVDADSTVGVIQHPPAGMPVDAAGLLRTRMKHLMVKRGGNWLIVSSQNTAVIP